MPVVGLIPLRAGGTRMGPIEGLDKERALLGDFPLMAWTIRSALDSGIYENVVAVVASEEHAAMAEDYGAMVPFRRPAYTVQDTSPDIEWVSWVMKQFFEEYGTYDAFSILRVTSPFRTAENMQDAWELFRRARGAHSLRTVARANQDPFKMWVIRHDTLLPLFPIGDANEPWHSRASQNNPRVYAQTAGMEFAWTKMMLDTNTIAGSITVPFIVEGYSAMDLNSRLDWNLAEQAIRDGKIELPESLT